MKGGKGVSGIEPNIIASAVGNSLYILEFLKLKLSMPRYTQAIQPEKTKF